MKSNEIVSVSAARIRLRSKRGHSSKCTATRLIVGRLSIRSALCTKYLLKTQFIARFRVSLRGERRVLADRL